jgi:hypothetical protein
LRLTQDFTTQNESFEFKTFDEANFRHVPIVLFTVKTVYISAGTLPQIGAYSIEWDDVKVMPAETNEKKFVNDGGTIITVDENKTKKQPVVTVYGGELLQNPSALKFVK